MDALSKASLYLGTVLLIGAGCFGFFIGRSKTRELQVWASLGFVLLVFFSNLNLVQTVYKVLKQFDPSFIWQYAISTQHGHLTFIRLGLALVLLILINLSGFTKARAVVFTLASLWLLSTFSQLSHASAMRGTPAMLADLIHYSAATLWSSSILYSVINKIWSRPDFENILRRVSRLALVSVLLLIATGIYTSQIHIQTLDALFSTIYGHRLMIKLGIFVLVLGLAGINRWYFMPRLQSKSSSLKRALIIEAVLLAGILGLTGLLTVSPLPHEM